MLARLISGWKFQAALCAAILALGVWDLFYAGARFDREAWLNAAPDSRTRARMVDDLVARYPLRRMRGPGILALLGPPTTTDKYQDWNLVYALGSDSGWFTSDEEWLLFDLDGAGLVINYQVAYD